MDTNDDDSSASDDETSNIHVASNASASVSSDLRVARVFGTHKYNHSDANVQAILNKLCPMAEDATISSATRLVYPDPRADGLFSETEFQTIDVEYLRLINAAIALAMTSHTGRVYVGNGTTCKSEGKDTGFKMGCQNKVWFVKCYSSRRFH